MKPILAALVLLLIPAFAHADAWVLWQYTQNSPSSVSWRPYDAFENLKACKGAALKEMQSLAKITKQELRELNAGYWFVTTDKGIIYKSLCVPGGSNPGVVTTPGT